MLWHRVDLKCLRELPVASSTVFAFVKFFLIQCFSAFCRKCLTAGSWYAGGFENEESDHGKDEDRFVT